MLPKDFDFPSTALKILPCTGVGASMTVLVTGSSGHLGEALMRTLRDAGREAVGSTSLPGRSPRWSGSIADRASVARCIHGADRFFHAATLHKPHVATHAREAFVETNVLGALILIEEAARARVRAFVMTSTTSAFGDALKPPPGKPAAWIDKSVAPVPKNIYGVTKTTAEDLCQLFHRNEGLASIVLRTSRFFPEQDDDPQAREVVRRRQRQGERISVSPGCDRGRGRRASPRGRACAVDRLWEIHHQRDDAVFAGGLRAPPGRRARCRQPSRGRVGKTNMRGAAGGCSRRSIASTTTRSRAGSLAGGRSGISRP